MSDALSRGRLPLRYVPAAHSHGGRDPPGVDSKQNPRGLQGTDKPPGREEAPLAEETRIFKLDGYSDLPVLRPFLRRERHLSLHGSSRSDAGRGDTDARCLLHRAPKRREV